jgi:hypothetical protein
MTRILNSACGLLACLICVAAVAQTSPPTNDAARGTNTTFGGTNSATTGTNASPTNAVPKIIRPELQTNEDAFTNLPAYSIMTNQAAAATNLNYLLYTMPNQPPLLGPGVVGGAQPINPLGGIRGIGVPPGAGFPAGLVGPGIPVYGPVTLHPSLLYLFAEADNVENKPGQTQATIQQTVALDLLFTLGQKWSLDYSPGYSFYSEGGFQNEISQNLVLKGGTTYEDWTLGFLQSYFSTFEPLIETGQQTSENAYDTSANAVYQMGSSFALSLGADQNIRDTGGFNNVDSWSGTVGLNYLISPQLTAGLSLSGGYDAVSDSSDMPFEVAEGTLTFHPAEKLNIFVSGGAEDVQFIHPSAPPLITPVFSAAVGYRLFAGTTVSASGSRTVTPAFFGNTVQISTTVGASIQQVLTRKLTLSLNAGYTSEPLTEIVAAPLPQYFIGRPTSTTLEEAETLNSKLVGLTLSYAVLDKLTLSAYGSLSDTVSSQQNYKYSSTQVGFSVSYRY